jgi:hypothetical protein
MHSCTNNSDAQQAMPSVTKVTSGSTHLLVHSASGTVKRVDDLQQEPDASSQKLTRSKMVSSSRRELNKPKKCKKKRSFKQRKISIGESIDQADYSENEEDEEADDAIDYMRSK